MADRRRYALIAIAILVIGATVQFKYMTGSFLTISEESWFEVQRYTIDFRRHDLTIPSLTASCKDIGDLYDRLLADTDFDTSPCLGRISMALERSPKDSVVLMVFQEMMRHAVYARSQEHDGLRVNEVYSDSSVICGGPARLVFTRNEADDWLIVDLKDLDRFMECVCPASQTSHE